MTCALLERDALPSGSTALSSGFIPAAGTRTQARPACDDPPERFAADIQAKAHGTAAPHLVQAYTARHRAGTGWLQARHGLQWELLDGFLYPGHALRRMHCLAAAHRCGADGRARRRGAARRRNAVDTRTGARAVVRQPAAACSASASSGPTAASNTWVVDLLLLACNGFGGNRQMVREWLPEMRDAVFAGHTGNDGSAIDWGRQLGAALADLGGYQGHGSWAVPQGVLISWALDEAKARCRSTHAASASTTRSQGYSEAAVQVLAQPGGIAWNVFDEAAARAGTQLPGLSSRPRPPAQCDLRGTWPRWRR